MLDDKFGLSSISGVGFHSSNGWWKICPPSAIRHHLTPYCWGVCPTIWLMPLTGLNSRSKSHHVMPPTRWCPHRAWPALKTQLPTPSAPLLNPVRISWSSHPLKSSMNFGRLVRCFKICGGTLSLCNPACVSNHRLSRK